ncbi:hypothetical protein LSTR_LSTR000756 [Laodelphax striatellus]|uniref:Uncharacterized protein n=1 Tax=Laodelphax striatellus TaxID=195883 RepID=A0A482XGE6_LAOST|nr:hypothetical protein LSTR_LSTR000756 [Laodelphax striatellus]
MSSAPRIDCADKLGLAVARGLKRAVAGPCKGRMDPLFRDPTCLCNRVFNSLAGISFGRGSAASNRPDQQAVWPQRVAKPPLGAAAGRVSVHEAEMELVFGVIFMGPILLAGSKPCTVHTAAFG